MQEKPVPAWHYSKQDGWYELNEAELAHVSAALSGMVPKIKSYYENKITFLKAENTKLQAEVAKLQEELKAAYGVKNDFVDLSQVRGTNSRYKAYEDLIRRGDELCNEVFLDTTNEYPLKHITTKEELLEAFGLPQSDFSVLDKYALMEPKTCNVVKIEDMDDEVLSQEKKTKYELMAHNIAAIKNMMNPNVVWPEL